MQKLALDLSVAQVLPKKIKKFKKMISTINNLGFDDVNQTVSLSGCQTFVPSSLEA